MKGGIFSKYATNLKTTISRRSLKTLGLLLLLFEFNNNRSKSEFYMFLWDILVFRLVAYLLNMICFKLRLLYQIWNRYIVSGIILTQFHINFSRQEHLCDNLYPLSFFLYSPFETKKFRSLFKSISRTFSDNQQFKITKY